MASDQLTRRDVGKKGPGYLVYLIKYDNTFMSTRKGNKGLCRLCYFSMFAKSCEAFS